MPQNLPEIAFHYIKSADFETKYMTGVIGGLTSNGMINVNAFFERPVIPQVIVQSYNPSTGKLNPEILREERKEGIIREVHTGLVMDEKTTKSLIVWLTEQLSILEEAKKSKI